LMKYKFKVPCSKSRLGDIREFLERVLSENDVPEVTVGTLVLAVDEVCANLIIHSHNCNEQEHIELKVDVNKNSGITFYIIDHGDGFNIGNYQEPSISEIVRTKRKGGIGLMLVRRIMDDIEFIKEKHKNIYRLHKNI
jgi:serine/threonine-protein kinase RsbW